MVRYVILNILRCILLLGLHYVMLYPIIYCYIKFMLTIQLTNSMEQSPS
jgi:hypothetical protein